MRPNLWSPSPCKAFESLGIKVAPIVKMFGRRHRAAPKGLENAARRTFRFTRKPVSPKPSKPRATHQPQCRQVLKPVGAAGPTCPQGSHQNVPAKVGV